MKIPFHRPLFPNETIDSIEEVLSSGWVTTGKITHLFENKLCEYLEAKYVIAVNSCTSALHLGAIISGLSKKEKFIVPTYTFVSSVEIGEYIGAEPLLVDVDQKTMNLDLNQVENYLKKYGKRIKTIIPVHLAGNPVKMNELRNLSNAYGCFLLEDGAHALEAIDDGKKIGNTEDAATFSFYANKNITTGGEGGAIATNNTSLAEKLKKLSLHGMNKDGWSRYSNTGKWSYDIGLLGYKYNLTDIASKIGLIQLQNIKSWHNKREIIAKKYDKGFSAINGIKLPPQQGKNSMHARHLYIIQINKKYWSIDRNQIIVELNKKGIGTSVHYLPIHMHSYYQKKYGFKPNDYPQSKVLFEAAISLPIYPDLNNNEILYIIDSIKELWNKYSI
tara:strand:- start:10976 stop:12142 length:1167 start_codon:yes stop_codon:yes gene_type:complete